MARPIKDGVDYFPKDVGFYYDDKIRLLRGEFGAKGMYLLDYLLCDLYGKNGYYMQWDESKCYLVSDGAGCGCDSGFVSEFIQGCLRRSFFSERMFRLFGILTSEGIQRRYIRMFNSRENLIIVREYFLLDASNPNDVPAGVLPKLAFKNISCTENPDKSTENPDKSTENPIKESKVKESKIKVEEIIDFFHDTCVSYPRITALSERRRQAVQARLKQYSVEDFKRMFAKAEASDFLKGANKNDWRANFDWLMRDSNFAKVLDGNYDNRVHKTVSEEEESNMFLQLLHEKYDGR